MSINECNELFRRTSNKEHDIVMSKLERIIKHQYKIKKIPGVILVTAGIICLIFALLLVLDMAINGASAKDNVLRVLVISICSLAVLILPGNSILALSTYKLNMLNNLKNQNYWILDSKTYKINSSNNNYNPNNFFNFEVRVETKDSIIDETFYCYDNPVEYPIGCKAWIVRIYDGKEHRHEIIVLR